MDRKKLSSIGMFVFWASFANAIFFVLISCIVLGGFAYSGRVEGGHYFVGATRGIVMHEREVSQAAFTFNYIQGWTVLISFPIGVSAAFLSGFGGPRKS